LTSLYPPYDTVAFWNAVATGSGVGLGLGLGLGVGLAVGAGVGEAVGFAVGFGDGVGEAVGVAVGEAVGVGVGVAVGFVSILESGPSSNIPERATAPPTIATVARIPIITAGANPEFNLLLM
jgi:hypothetical protein